MARRRSRKSKRALLSFAWDVDTLTEAFKQFPKGTTKVVREAVDEIGNQAFRTIKFAKTPVDSRKLKDAWRKKSIRTRQGPAFEISNNTAYANTVEFGGYPVRAISRTKTTRGGGGSFRRGKAILGGLPPGPRTQRALGGKPKMVSNVSKAAKRGMVRSTLGSLEVRFVKLLEEKLDEFWAGFA